MPLVGCGLAVDLVRCDLACVRARISQQGPGLWPNNSQGEAALVFTCGCQVAVAVVMVVVVVMVVWSLSFMVVMVVMVEVVKRSRS